LTYILWYISSMMSLDTHVGIDFPGTKVRKEDGRLWLLFCGGERHG
jgi:hypothetical protein